MITTLNTRKLLTFAGLFALAAIALVFPLDALAGPTDTTTQAKQLAAQATNIPKLIAVGAYVIGAFFTVKALFALKGFIEAPDDNPITKAVAYGAIGALMILLPYLITIMTGTTGAANATKDNASAQFQNDTGTF